jgi:hypothetical protein
MPAPISLAAARKRKGKAPPPAETDEIACPITALGHVDGKFWFLNIVGEKRGLSARQMGSRPEITSLFLGDTAWLQRKFRATDAEGNPKGWSIARATEFLMAECRRAGIYGEHIVVRRPGVWPGEDGTLIAHCGDALFIDGEKHPSGAKVAGQVFAAAAPAPYPAETPCDALTARALCDDVRTLWRLQHEGGEIIAIGLVAQGYYAAGLSWRSNGFISGGTNSGKSALLNFLRAMTPLNHYSNDTTKAGIEGAISGRAMPCFIDEAFDHGGAETLLNVVLSASSGEGTKGHRGTADGSVRSIDLVGSVIMASINPPAMQPQHRSRFAMIELLRPEAGADHTALMKAATERALKAGPALFERALAGFDRYKAALQALGAAGCVAREMDQIGSILAGHWVLAENGVPDIDAAAETVKIIGEFIVGGEEMRADSAPQAVLAMLLSKVVSLDRSTDQESIAKLIRNCFEPLSTPGDEHARFAAMRVLARWGLRPVRADEVVDGQGRVIPRMTMTAGVWIDPRWQPLRGIFANTPHDGDRWIVELRRLPSAWKSPKVVRVSELGPCKAIWISWDEIDKFEE